MTALARREQLVVAGRALAVTNLDQVVFPSSGFRKRDVIAYYREVAPVLLPHVRDRALQLARWPDGVGRPGWIQASGRENPPWLVHAQCVLDDEAALVWSANRGAIELHPRAASLDRPDEPRALIFDLVPGPGCGLRDCARAARLLHEALAPLHCFAKTSGIAGLQVYVPLNGGATSAEAQAFARRVAHELATLHADWLTDRPTRSRRVIVDVSRNAPGAPSVAPYSLHATLVPLVSAPLRWDEVGTTVPVTPERMLERIARHGDLFADVLELRQRLV